MYICITLIYLVSVQNIRSYKIECKNKMRINSTSLVTFIQWPDKAYAQVNEIMNLTCHKASESVFLF